MFFFAFFRFNIVKLSRQLPMVSVEWFGIGFPSEVVKMQVPSDVLDTFAQNRGSACTTLTLALLIDLMYTLHVVILSSHGKLPFCDRCVLCFLCNSAHQLRILQQANLPSAKPTNTLQVMTAITANLYFIFSPKIPTKLLSYATV